MALSDVDICNMALSALGTDDTIAALTEGTREAQQCRRWYEPVRDLVHAAAPWPELHAYMRLPLLVARDMSQPWQNTDPAPGWLFAYGRPADMLQPYHMNDFSAFVLSTTGANASILSNAEEPILEYTRTEAQVDRWSIGLQHAVAYALAAHIAKALTGKDSDLQNMYTLAAEKIADARASAANASMNDPLESVPDWLVARGYSQLGPNQRFIYPAVPFVMMGMPRG